MKYFISLLILMIPFLNLYSQTMVNGVVLDTLHNSVEFVNIGFKERGIGTVCDVNGHFSLMVPDSLKNDFIVFSHLNYKTKHLLPEDIKNNNTIILEKRQVELPDIVILPQKTATKWIKKGFGINGYCEFENLGEEAGIVLKLNKKALLRDVKFKVKSCTFDSVLIRANIYKLKGIEPLYLQPLYKMVYKNKKNNYYNLAINEQVLLNQEEEILVCIECVQYFGEGYIWFPAFIGTGYAREVSLDQFKRMAFNPGIAIKVTFIN